MLRPEYTSRFKKDLKSVKKSNLNIENLKTVIDLLVKEKPLPQKYYDHPLRGNWKGCRECHIQPDWLLIYQVGNGLIVFERTGTHSELY